MADLIAQGSESQHRWRRSLPEGRWVELGRGSSGFSTPWDDLISRHHVKLRWQDGQLDIRRLPSGRNPIFLRGQEIDEFQIRPDEYFVIGQTTFTLKVDSVSVSPDVPPPVEEQTYSPQYLKQLRYRNADQRIDVLSRLPEVISRASSDRELFVQLVNLLLVGVPRADAVALVEVDGGDSVSEGGDPEADLHQAGGLTIMHWDRRRLDGGRFRPSQRLISQAVHRQQSVLHVWDPKAESRSQPYTMSENADWAFCTPVLGESSKHWALYVTGRFDVGSAGEGSSTDPKDLRDDLKFTELVAAFLRSLFQQRELHRRYVGLSQFFAPAVLNALADDSQSEVLAPREAEVAVLFCDLRGFSRESERLADDLMGLLERVSRALGVMTYHILDQGGVVGDFQGDAAMGFWGWPLSEPDIVGRATRAALGIRAEFEKAARHADDELADFRVGIGIATGRAVAGRIGTVDKVKVTVFGPVVNLASRLEGMTKIFRTPILLDETTASRIRHVEGENAPRCRRVAVVKPYGMHKAVEVSELLPPEGEPLTLSSEEVAAYETALDAFLAGRWEEAFDLLHRVTPQDHVKDFLTVHIAQHNRMPPPGFNGVIELTRKG